ncbi:MAG: alanine racemase [Polyangiaceae bacterium]|nr:alanine racemase [Polyangiaceae bacterium]
MTLPKGNPTPKGAFVTLLSRGAGVATSLIRPPNTGAPHAEPFSTYNRLLREHGEGKPTLLIDLNELNRNMEVVRRSVPPEIAVRVVTKSLPSIPLIRRAMEGLNTNRLMVFDHSILQLVKEFPRADFLMGKPLPVRAVSTFLNALSPSEGRNAASQVAWLVDTPERLAELIQLARSTRLSLRFVVEIDIGLHRGGVETPSELTVLLRAVDAAGGAVSFAGLMGYDAHVGSAPPVISGTDKAFAQANEQYKSFKDAVTSHKSALGTYPLIYNGAGSKTYPFYNARHPVNEVALGSVLVKPTDFDVPSLNDHRPACFIAAPVLKCLPGPRIPFLEKAQKAWRLYNPNRRVSYFIFGGGWLAKPVSPAGLSPNPVYGFSTNQALLSGSVETALQVDDYIFFRPTQSERVLMEFGDLQTVRDQTLGERWPALPF